MEKEVVTRETILGDILSSKFKEQKVVYGEDVVNIWLGLLFIRLTDQDIQIQTTNMSLTFKYSGLKNFYTMSNSEYIDRNKITIIHEDLDYPEENHYIEISFGTKVKEGVDNE